MKTKNLVFSIVLILIIVFLLFVFYSKGQWKQVNEEIIEEPPSGIEPEATGHIKFTILKHNESGFCNNSYDDDDDTFLDCDDADCYFEEVCQNETSQVE